MLTGQGHTYTFKSVTVNIVPGSVLSLAAGALLIYAFVTTGWNEVEPIERTETVNEMGMMLMGSYILPFIVIGVLLLIAIIGAILMSTRISTENRN